MIPISLPDPIGTRPRHFTCLVLAMGVLTAAYVAERTNYWLERWQAGSSPGANGQTVTVYVGDNYLHLPLHLITTRHQRQKSLSRNNRFNMLHLSMEWPDLSAPKNGFAGPVKFNSDTQTILVDLESNQGRESMRARLGPLYRRLARGGEIKGPGGLTILNLSARRYGKSDVIVYDPSEQNGFIARCIEGVSGGGATCHRAVALTSGLELRYRFNQGLLPDWRQLDDGISRKISDFLSEKLPHSP